MSDFERTFGAGADAVSIIDGYARRDTTRRRALYRVVFVRFLEDGKPHPVNSRFHVEPGDFVVVRLDGAFTPLQKAQVVSVEYWKGPVRKHHVACLADEAEAYGVGWEGIQNEEDLDRFLLGFVSLKKFPVAVSGTSPSLEPVPHAKWRRAYLSRSGFGELGDGHFRVSMAILISDKEIHISSPDDGESIQMQGGALILDYGLSYGLPRGGKDRYQLTAKQAERYLTDDTEGYTSATPSNLC